MNNTDSIFGKVEYIDSTIKVFDKNNRLIFLLENDVKYTFDYDENGNTVKVTSNDGFKEINKYCEHGNLIYSELHNKTAVNRYWYENGNKVKGEYESDGYKICFDFDGNDSHKGKNITEYKRELIYTNFKDL